MRRIVLLQAAFKPVNGVPPTGMLLYSTLIMCGPTSSGENSARNPLLTLPVTWSENHLHYLAMFKELMNRSQHVLNKSPLDILWQSPNFINWCVRVPEPVGRFVDPWWRRPTRHSPRSRRESGSWPFCSPGTIPGGARQPILCLEYR